MSARAKGLHIDGVALSLVAAIVLLGLINLVRRGSVR